MHRSARRLRALGFTFVAVASGLFIYACGGDDSTNGTTPSNDASAGDATTTSDGSIVTDSAAQDSAVAPDGSTTDSGAKKDGGVTPPITKCATPVRVDTLGKVNPQALVGASFGGKYVFTWTQDGSLSGDGQPHEKARYFDGTAFTTEIDLGLGLPNAAFASVDASGKAYLVRVQAAGPILGRDVFDLTTGALAVPTATVPFHIGNTDSYSVGALPAGALALYEATGAAKEIADLYTPGKGWSNGGDAGIDAGAPMPIVSSTALDARVALNSAGKGAVVWDETGSGTDFLVHLASFDGTKLGAVVDHDVPAGGELMSAAALSNGDVALTWIASPSSTPNINFTMFHPSAAVGSQFDADLNLGAWVNGGGGPLIFVDPHDNVTVIWVDDGVHVVAKKRIGTTWSSLIAIGSALGPTASLDPNGNLVIITEDGSHNALVTRMPEDATTIGSLISTTLATGNTPNVAFAFNASGDPVVGVWGSHSGDFELWAATCANGL